jgi:hypothetical protein
MAFLIVAESVRRMFRAKPSMHVIVVQLLVDLLRITAGGTRSQLVIQKNFFQIDDHIFDMRRQGSGKDRQPSRLLLTTFRLLKTVEAGVAGLCSINQIGATQNKSKLITISENPGSDVL